MAQPTSAVSITIGANSAVKGVGSVNLTVTQQPIEVTGLGDAFTRHLAGIVTAQCDLDFFWDSSIAGHTAILTAIEASSQIDPLTITWQAGKSISGKAMVTSWNLTSSPNGVNQVTASLIYTDNDAAASGSLVITQ